MQGDPRVAGQPRLDRGVLVGGVVVAHHVQLDPRVGLGDLLEEPQELLVAVPGVAGVGRPSRWPPRARRTGWWCRGGRSRGSASPASRAAAAGSARSGPAPGPGTSRRRRPPPPAPAGSGTGRRRRGSWLPARGSVENLNVSIRHGCRPHLRHDRGDGDVADAQLLASSRLDQCVTPSRAGGGSKVPSTIATSSTGRVDPTSAGRPARRSPRWHTGASSRSPSACSPPPDARSPRCRPLSGQQHDPRPLRQPRPHRRRPRPRRQHHPVGRRHLHTHSQRHAS